MVNRQPKQRVHRTIDKTKTVRLILLEPQLIALASLAVFVVKAKYIRAIDETIVQRRRPMYLLSGQQMMHGWMRPIVENDDTEIFIVVGARRAVDDDGAEDTVVGLEGKVRVVP